MRPSSSRRLVALAAAAMVCGSVVACDEESAPAASAVAVTATTAGTAGTATTAGTAGTAGTPLSPASRALRAYDAMTPAERVGQLVMAGVPTVGSTAKQRARLRRYAIGNVYLAKNSTAPAVRVRAAAAPARRAATRGSVRPFVSIDQEGGQVQRLTGPGFSRMPSALEQGRLTPKKLAARATTWGRQLAAAGVNLDLAPVADVVPAKGARRNQPIGQYDREYGHTPAVVAPRVAAFVRGMNAGGVETSVKHFPGLGRATGNTDVARDVTDPTKRRSAYIRPYRAGINAGTAFVMVSSATYPNIDAKRRACFSPTVIGGMLRGDLGFDGVVVSDDLGAVELQPLSWGKRATRFIDAGGTMLLTVRTANVGAMTRAVRAEAKADARFAAKVRTAVLTVLEAKARAGLLG